MAPPEKITSSGPQDRRKLNVIVYVRLGYLPVVITLTGSKYEGMEPLPEYYYPSTIEGQPGLQYKALSAIEYQATADEAIPKLTTRDSKREGLRGRGPLWLLQDEGRPHTALSTTVWAAAYQARPLHLITLPTHSPDLTPMDANFFGTVKAQWNRERKAERLSWAESCNRALKILRNTDPAKYIKEMPLRWKACQDVRGGHIEARLKVLKRQQPQ